MDIDKLYSINAIRKGLMEQARPKPAIMLVILANGDKHIYSGLKHLCDSWLGIGTVCVQSGKIRNQKGMQLQPFMTPLSLTYLSRPASILCQRRVEVEHEARWQQVSFTSAHT